MTAVDELVHLGRMIERERKARKLTRAKLAEQADVTEQTIYHLETGANSSTRTLLNTLKALKTQSVVCSSR